MLMLESTEAIKKEEATSALAYGPLTEQGQLSAGLDYYKPTMSQLAFEQEPGAIATFTFKNRGDQRLLDYIDQENLVQRFNQIRQNGWSKSELDYLGSLRDSDDKAVFTDDYLQFLSHASIPPVEVKYDQEKDDLCFETTGPWALSTFWETVVMSEVNEAYFEGYLRKNNINPLDVYEEGDRRLSAKIEILNQRPDIKFADFGTRRHFSLRWQKHVIERLKNECPQNFIGTSNVSLAESCDLKPIGTFAHEMPMAYAGLADARGLDVRSSHKNFLNAWFDRYGDDLSTALTDTFTTDFFFSDFSPEQARKWKGVRHDSGDPFDFAEKLIGFYETSGIDPKTKTVVFSDGLDIETIVALQDRFKGRINTVYGWGTTLTNDLGIKPLNVVMKLTHVALPFWGREADTVKLSDNEGKHTGPEKLVKLYKEIFKAVSCHGN